MENFWREREDTEQILLILSIITVIIFYIDTHYNKIPCRISDLSGEKYVEGLIQQQHPRRIQEIFCMPLYTFLHLQSWLLDNTELDASRHIGVAEKLAIFIDTVGRGVTNRGVQERF